MLFAIGFGSLAVVTSATGVVVTVVFWTFGEMMLFPATAAHLGEVAPENKRGAYRGAYSMSLSVALARCPGSGTQLLASTGPVGVGIDENLDVAQVANSLVDEEQNSIDYDHVGRLYSRRAWAPEVSHEIVFRLVDRFAFAQCFQMRA